MVVYCKKAKYGIKEAEAIILDCIDENFEREALNIVKSVYESKTEYTYTNEKIAELLDFKDFDLKNSYACYTEKQRKERRKQTQSRYDNRRYKTIRQSKAELKQHRRDFIKEHMEMPVKELAKALGCSERTIRYIRADMRKSDREA